MRTTITVLTLVAMCSVLASGQNTLVPSIAPLKGMSAKDVKKSFGKIMHPLLKMERVHNGVDIAAHVGTEVQSTADGTIAVVGENDAEGRFVQVRHSKGYETRYTHLSNIVVTEGQRVKQGSHIAHSGNTGMTSGPHLHYEVVHNGKHVDPEHFLAVK